MPELFDEGSEIYGTDYNENSIKWCTQNLQDIRFSTNKLRPPLKFKDEFFSVIYGISIFTHLSAEMHFAWTNELHRVLKPDGIMFITTAGQSHRVKLSPHEKLRFDKGELIIRGRVREGHRTYSAMHPAGFMHELFSGFEILEHIEREPVGKYIPQDIWILKRISIRKGPDMGEN
jgi:predicted SAM-dependent methyltransferase